MFLVWRNSSCQLDMEKVHGPCILLSPSRPRMVGVSILAEHVIRPV